MDIQISSNCGNAPKQQYVKDFIVALGKGEFEDAFEMLTDDVSLEVVGQKPARGLEAVKQFITADEHRSKIIRLQIDDIISHGKICTARGLQEFADGRKVAFSNWYTFSSHGKNAKIQAVQTYLVAV